MPTAAQGFFGKIPEKLHQVDIPFEYTNNFIILTLYFQGVFPLKFIYDTGSEYTILTKRRVADMMQVPFEREFRLIGSDMKSELIAYLARRIRFDSQDHIMSTTQDILVLQEDYFRFEEFAGVEVHGILAGNVFANFFVKINYSKQILTLIERQHFALVETGFDTLKLETIRSKLYLNTELELAGGTNLPTKLLLDTGAGLPLLLFSDSHPQLHPPERAIPGNIGMGLGGFLEGFRGRVPLLKLGKFEQRAVLTDFQPLDSTISLEHLNGRNGLIGNRVLDRFTVILDYYGEQVFLKPNRRYRKEFAFDRSGLSLLVSGGDLTQFTVNHVLPNSPAAEAGILKGDRIVKVGFFPASFYSLAEMNKVFEKKSGKKIKVVLRRDGKRMRRFLVLRDLI